MYTERIPFIGISAALGWFIYVAPILEKAKFVVFYVVNRGSRPHL
jgi:hypothetical protein